MDIEVGLVVEREGPISMLVDPIETGLWSRMSIMTCIMVGW
jgi:hypothetical protein